MSLKDVTGDPLVDELDHWLKHKEVIRRRAAGMGVEQIAVEMGVERRTIYRWIAEAANAIRSENKSFTQEQFLINYHRLERLYELIEQKLVEVGFQRDVFRAAIDILDRQSRMLGLDRGGPSRGQWLETASNDDLVAEARRLGIKIPDNFQVPR